MAEHRLVDAETLRAHCADGTLSELGHYDEGPLRVEYHQHSSGGLLIKTKSFGDHLICEGGRSMLSSVKGLDGERWQRYVLGQVLPLTASVQGLEIFHASAVAINGGVLALAGPSGSGKSSVAGALIEQGATFFTDDVLAIDAGAFGVKAYPGPTLMAVPHDQAPGLEAKLFTGPPWAEDERKILVPVRGERGALPIFAFVRLVRDPDADEITSKSCLPDRLMATTFDGVSRTPERLRRLLRVGAMLAADERALEIHYPADSDPAVIAEALLGEIKASAAGGRAG